MKTHPIYKAYLAFLTFLVSLPALAPVLLHLGLDFLAKPLYLIYNFLCHQFHTRSLYLFDYQYACCARCTGIWLGALTAAILVQKGTFKNISLLILPIFMLPIAIDGGLQTVATFLELEPDGSIDSEQVYHISNNFLRFVTGSFFGLGFGWWFSRQLHKTLTNSHAGFSIPSIQEIRDQITSVSFRDVRLYGTKILLIMLVLTSVYIIGVQAWAVTSHETEPTNALDSVPKVNEDDFLERRADAVCPTVGRNIYDLDCFFE